jgi:plastocyanin
VGGTITWKSTSTITHTTTDEASLAAKASDAALPTGATGWNHSLSPGTSWSLKFTVAGLYKYFCIPHETLGMLGQITVVSSTSSSSSAPSSSGTSATCSNPQSSVTIDATDSLRFSPASVCLKVGGKVTWKNTGTITHTTTDEASLAAKASDAALPSGATGWNHTLAPGTSFTLKFTVAGLYKYFCIPHETLGMLGQITVVS